MDDKIEKLNNLHKKAVDEWSKEGKGIIEVATGLGKTFIALQIISRLEKSSKVLFAYEVVTRKKTLLKEIDKYDKLFKTSLKTDYEIHFTTYQSAYKWKNKHFNLLVADEVHEMLSPSYIKLLLNNSFDKRVGLTALLQRETTYSNNKTKGDYADMFGPIVFKVSLKQSRDKGLSRKLDIIVVDHKMTNEEQKEYNLFKRSYVKGMITKNEYLIRINSIRMASLLFKLPSKAETCKRILETLNGKTLVYANDLNLLYITVGKENVVDGYKKDDENNHILKQFENNQITTIGSFKKLEQGINLELDNIIILSYYSKLKSFIQRIGRLRRSEKIGKVYLIKTIGTKEEKWIKEIINYI